MEDRKLKLSGYKRKENTCSKCGWKTIVETDVLSDSQIDNVHKCQKGKGKQ